MYSKKRATNEHPNTQPQLPLDPYETGAVFGPGNPVRAVHAGALAVLDEAIGNISSAIIAAGLWEDTLIFFFFR